MAVVAVKGFAITNRDSSPKVINDAAHANASMKGFVGAAAITSGNSVGSTYLLGSIPSNAIVHSLLASSSADMGTTTTANIGLYKTTADGGAVVDADFFKATLDLKGGAITNTEVANGNVITLANSYKKVYELLGLTSDPCIQYDVVATLDGACDGSGVLQLKCQYAI